ncbi:MAG: inorganic phosphate transporter [Bacteroidia bacterium]|jgi:PiT family inorganic phosphate transporter|nr:inorganic phosphate transporter [Bacteroidia bacterium]
MTLLIFIILLALLFDFLNGFHDAANSIATVVSTKVLTPVIAVVWAALFNFIAFLVFGLHVASTVGKGVVHPEYMDLTSVASGLIGAIIVDILTWYLGLPTSSSHALVGGVVGAALAKGGISAIIFSGIDKILIFIVVSPLVGMVLSYIISSLVEVIARKAHPSKIDSLFRRLQFLSSAAFSLGHGGSDAQKTMGIIWMALIVNKTIPANAGLPFWAVILCQIAMAFGTLFGGWRIVKTMGQKITKLRPFEGFCAETAGALTLYSTIFFGIPVSTTHTITGSIVGVGARKRFSAVRWGVTRRIVWAWILTIPVSSAIAALCYEVTKLF